VKLTDKAKQAGAAVGVAVAAYKATVTVTGAPVRKRLEPATITIAGIPVFERSAELDRTWFGFIRRGKSRLARKALAARGGGSDGNGGQ
jgi:hypothetical protein